jgi:molecular chaperone GrpE (heat shock protein)
VQLASANDENMAQPDELIEPDNLDAQLQGLYIEAARDTAADDRPGKGAPSKPETTGASDTTKGAALSQSQVLTPVLKWLETLSKTAHESNNVLKKLEGDAAIAAQAHKTLPHLVADLRSILEVKTGVSQSMFAALHEELKSYKDGFLLDSVHKPIIRDLIALYDDTVEIQRQICAVVKTAAQPDGTQTQHAVSKPLETLVVNIEHHIEFLAEVLNRLEVTRVDVGLGKLDKEKQRAVATEDTEDPDADWSIVRTVKRGFQWKGRIFRPEEVVIRRWKEGYFAALKPEQT